MNTIRQAFAERPRVVILWIVLLTILVGGVYLGAEGLAGAGNDEIDSLEGELAASETAAEQAQEQFAEAGARNDTLEARLRTQDQRVEALQLKNRKLKRRVAATEAAATPPRRRR